VLPIPAIRGGRTEEIYVIKPSLKYSSSKEDVLRISLHEPDFEKLLVMAKILKVLPKEVITVSCQPKKLFEGLEMSEEVKRAIKKTVEVILE